MDVFDDVSIRGVGRRAAEAISRSSERPAFSRELMTVKSVEDSGLTLVSAGSETMSGIPMTTACAGVQPGDTVVLDVYAHVPLVTGVISRNLHYVKLFTGTLVRNASDTSILMWTQQQFSDDFGRPFDVSTDFVAVMNGDGAANNAHVTGAVFKDGLYADFDRKVVGLIRVTYLVALG